MRFAVTIASCSCVIGTRLLAGALLGLATGCNAPHPLMVADDLVRELNARTVLVSDDLTLYSPYDVELSQEFLDVCLQELSLARDVIGAAPDWPVPLVLLVVENAPGSPKGAGAIHQGLAASADPAGFASALVPQPGGALAALAPESSRSSLRHELAHLCLYALEVPESRWFSEAVASEVELVIDQEGGPWRVHPLPKRLLPLLVDPSLPSVEELLSWSGRRGDPAAERRLYDAAWSLFRYATLVTEAEAAESEQISAMQGPTLRSVIERVAKLDDRALNALEPGWHAWLRGFDVLAVLTALADEGPKSQRIAGQVLLTAAERGLPQVANASADSLAGALLLSDDARASGAADTFLVLFRGAALEPPFIDNLSVMGDPRAVLTAQALRQQLGLAVDRAAVRAARLELSSEQLRLSWSEKILGPMDE